MSINEIKISIDCQIRNQTNYIQHNAIRICSEALKIKTLSFVEVEEIKEIRKEIEIAKDPWQWNGTPGRNETIIIIDYLNCLYRILDNNF